MVLNRARILGSRSCLPTTRSTCFQSVAIMSQDLSFWRRPHFALVLFCEAASVWTMDQGGFGKIGSKGGWTSPATGDVSLAGLLDGDSNLEGSYDRAV